MISKSIAPWAKPRRDSTQNVIGPIVITVFGLPVVMDDSCVTVSQMKDMVRAFCEERDWDQYHNPKDLAIGMVTESSELLDIFRFKSPGDIEAIMADPVRSAHVKEELSDVLYFALRFAQMNGIDLYSELVRKIGIDGEKYPVEKSRGRNLKYDEL